MGLKREFQPQSGAGCGIRTHATLPSNGFQDRRVMTTSLTLRIFILYIIPHPTVFVKVFAKISDSSAGNKVGEAVRTVSIGNLHPDTF